MEDEGLNVKAKGSFKVDNLITVMHRTSLITGVCSLNEWIETLCLLYHSRMLKLRFDNSVKVRSRGSVFILTPEVFQKSRGEGLRVEPSPRFKPLRRPEHFSPCIS
jgi:hypothetical protein